MNWITSHKLLTIVLVIVIAGGVWYGMTSSNSSGGDSVLSTDSSLQTGAPSTDAADQQLVETLLSLRAVTLSGSIFADPAFTSLKDFSTTIVSEPVGRPNPFAPISAAGASAAPATPAH